MLCYEVNPVRGSGIPVNTDRMDPHKAYMRHFENFLFLDFMAQNGTFQEKREAEAELMICRRKMKFWTHHHAFVGETVRVLKEKMLVEWKRGGAENRIPLSAARV